jgi:hypothetical protein
MERAVTALHSLPNLGEKKAARQVTEPLLFLITLHISDSAIRRRYDFELPDLVAGSESNTPLKTGMLPKP